MKLAPISQKPVSTYRTSSEDDPTISESKENHKKRLWHSPPAINHAIAGATAGLVSTFLLHPVDVIKTRFQVQNGAHPIYRNTSQAFRLIVREEGWRALYQGLAPSLIGATASWSIYLYSYNLAKSFLKGTGELKRELGPVTHLLCAAQAGLVVCMLTNPLWVVKTRLEIQQQQAPRRSPASDQNYKGTYDALKRIWVEEGLRGMYKGVSPSIILVSHGALQFMAYEHIKRWLSGQGSHYGDGPVHLSTAEYVFTAASSKVFASTITYPYQVVRARMQQRSSELQVSQWSTAKQILSTSGLGGFYRGMVPNILKVVPSAALTFLAYENMMTWLSNRHGNG
mmetsp:Transcript_13267/g.21777  ORF Transcript_13267/g.21777 Transcript_13267/m.21777 type:complete len:340 (+) Transcript_13267:80-1099(+)